MAWRRIEIDELASSFGLNASVVREKQKLIRLIVKAREEQKVSDVFLAKKAGVSQNRIAKIESGVGTSKITFDELLNILGLLGYDFKITTKKAA